MRINARPAAGDPLGDNLAANDAVGLIAIEFATRRRMRLNGKAEVGKDGAITIHAQQVYSNCPKYIQARRWRERPPAADSTPMVRRQSVLSQDQQRWIRESDTFFIASHHPESGADASHRGGYPGFVHVLNDHLLVWPDYAGNTMFQTLGNISVNPQAGLLFVDFERGGTLQLTGRARILWDEERAAEFAGAERLVEFDVDEVIEIAGRTRWSGDSWITRLKTPLEEEMQRFPLNKGGSAGATAVAQARGLSREHGRPIEMAVQLSYEALRQGFRNSQHNPPTPFY